MNKPQISVIMSFYNDEKYLKSSVLSILNQTSRNFEFIIINDYSTDGSATIVKNILRKDNRIKLINNSSNIGLTKSLNKAIRASSGRYIARQDADDISLPERLEKQFVFLENNPDIFLCGTDYDLIDDNSKIIEQDHNRTLNSLTINETLPKNNCLIHSSIMFRRNAVYYREKFYYAQDYDLYLNLISNNKFLSSLNIKLVLHRMQLNSVSYLQQKKQLLFTKKAREFYRQRKKYGTDTYKQFDPNQILKSNGSSFNSKAKLIEDKIKNYLKNNDFKKARDIYTVEYNTVPRGRLFTKISLFIFVHFPLTYKLYRKIIFKQRIDE